MSQETEQNSNQVNIDSSSNSTAPQEEKKYVFNQAEVNANQSINQNPYSGNAGGQQAQATPNRQPNGGWNGQPNQNQQPNGGWNGQPNQNQQPNGGWNGQANQYQQEPNGGWNGQPNQNQQPNGGWNGQPNQYGQPNGQWNGQPNQNQQPNGGWNGQPNQNQQPNGQWNGQPNQNQQPNGQWNGQPNQYGQPNGQWNRQPNPNQQQYSNMNNQQKKIQVNPFKLFNEQVKVPKIKTNEDARNVFFGVNQPYYNKVYKEYKEGKKISWNWSAFIFRSYWFFSRKMYTIGALYTLMMSFISFSVYQISQNINNTEILAMALPWAIVFIGLWASAGMFGNYIYMAHMENKILYPSDKAGSEEKITQMNVVRGGFSVYGILLCFMITDLILSLVQYIATML